MGRLLVRVGVVFIATLAVSCSGGSTVPPRLTPSPNPISPPTAQTGSLVDLWGFVIDDSGLCIDGATVQVVGGQGIGQSITQETPCSAWDYAGGFVFKNLTPGVAMTLRAAAPGWTTQEQTFVPPSATAVDLTLRKLP